MKFKKQDLIEGSQMKTKEIITSILKKNNIDFLHVANSEDVQLTGTTLIIENLVSKWRDSPR